MKKTLIALAALAATGAFAQSSVTISGKYAVAHQKAIGKQAGLATTDGDVRFTAVEDLGGGLKATAALELRVRGRGNSDAGSDNALDAAKNNLGVGGRNATVGLSGDFGSVTLGSVEAGNGIIGRGFAGAPVSLADGYDGAVLSGVANVDSFAYTTPALIPGLTATLTRVDSVGNPGSGRNTGGLYTVLSGNVIGASYAAGALSAGVDFTSFNNDRTRLRASASYNLGVATIGAGFEDNKKNGNFTDGTQLALGVSVPMGAVTLGAIYAMNEEGTSSLGAGKASGWGIGADYAFSKRTALNVSYADRLQKAGADDSKGDQYRVRLMHSF